MSYKKKNYRDYDKYKEIDFSNDIIENLPSYSQPNMTDINNNIQEPVMNTDQLFHLANFLETNPTNAPFPEITVIPDVLRNIARFANERKKMKYAHQEFEKKIQFLSDGLDKQYHIAMKTLEYETEIKLTQINGNIQQTLTSINRYYDTELAKIHANYQLESEKMHLYYKNLEEQRKDQEKRFNKMMKYATIDRKRASKAMKEVEDVCKVLQKRIYNRTATHQERKYYIELLKLRNSGMNMVNNIIPQLAQKIN